MSGQCFQSRGLHTNQEGRVLFSIHAMLIHKCDALLTPVLTCLETPPVTPQSNRVACKALGLLL